MFDDEVYEVTRDEFKGFMGQIKPSCFTYEKYNHGDTQEIKITSMDSTRHFATVKQSDEDIHYYIYEMPLDDERQAPQRVRQITLETKEEVQAFFNALNKIQKEEYTND